ncbi:GGDEF domain-containing protein [Acetobacter papayae]|uniref:GGDEF domain-containing protein n=1 Tax=Acetobacter papayae TaxID=1076592 RepID=UPI00131F01F8|nr:GGDEF domain-containing protein [Acetobacter papayae]
MVYPVEALSIAGLVLSPCVSGAAYFGLHHRTRRRAVLAPRSDCLTDELTGLPNRQALSNWMDKNLSARRQHVGRIALFMIDLDRFKEINDERGHSTGDEILRVLGRRLRHSVDAKRGEFIAHAGGDKFFAFCSFSNHRIVPDFLARLRRALSRPVRLQGGRVTIRANFGVAFWGDGAPSGETLLIRLNWP